MAFKYCILLSIALTCAAAQQYRVCVSSSAQSQCQSLELGDSRALCLSVESRVDCALQLERGAADIGYFTDEELLLLSTVQPNSHSVVATIRDSTKLLDPVSFEAVAVVPNSHTNGLEGLRGGKYCHPGLSEATFRWSPRVEKQLELAAAKTDVCPDVDTKDKTAEEVETEIISNFFGDSCRPGAWSANATHDAELKRKFPSLCAQCGPNSQCDYTLDMGPSIAGVNNNNAHIKALECLRTGGSAAYVAWQHAKEFFTIRNRDAASNFSLLCPDGTLTPLSDTVLAAATAPCAFVRQPWSAILATRTRAAEIQSNLRSWWPNQANPNDGSWRSTLYSILVPSWSNARVNFEDPLLTPANYTLPIRTIPSSSSTVSCTPARNWCATSTAELDKCRWLQNAAYILGIQPRINCQQRANVFDCLKAIADGATDFMVTKANYGYIARQHYKLTPVKLVQNHRSNVDSFSSVAALIKSTSASEVSRFENLKGKKACFPEYGGISYVSFVRTAQEVGVLSASECDYARAVGEFFDSSCAPGAMDATHAITETNYDATPLCTACRSTNNATTNFTCDWNYVNNQFYGNKGALSCLAETDVHVAFVETQKLKAHLDTLQLDGNQFRVLCRNNTLAAHTPVVNNQINIDKDCLLAHVVDSEVLTRRNDPAFISISTLLDTLERYFGYTGAGGTQHINLEIFSSFDGTPDLLFKNTAVGFSEPTSTTDSEEARNYIELFRHLQACTGTASNIPVPGLANRSFFSIVTLIASALLTRVVVY